MSRLWVFNPWNDLALGSDSTYYTPPPLVAGLACSGQTVPMWMAQPEDFVLVGEAGKEWWKKNCDIYNLAPPWEGQPVDGCVAWGWSKAIKETLRVSGVDMEVLPSDNTLDRIRELSHRRLTVEAHKYLHTGLEPVEAADEGSALIALRSYGRVVGKYPWSSTGRGLFSGDLLHIDSFLRRCRGAISHQGSVMIERAYDVVIDFAMLFRSSQNRGYEFDGYSLFLNDRRAYVANLLMPDGDISGILETHISRRELESVACRLEKFLSGILHGLPLPWVGVDMMVYRESDRTSRLNPCVEINLRLTMGVLSHILISRHLPSAFRGRLRIQSQPASQPPYITLNPPDSTFRFDVIPS